MRIIGLKSKCQQGSALGEGSGESSSPTLPASGGHGLPWLVAASLQSLPLWSHGPLCVCQITLVMGCRAHLDNPGLSLHLKILNSIMPAKTPFCHIRDIHKFQELGHGYLLGAIFSLPQ